MANYTPNYQLHQWEPEDPFLRTDFNADLSKIDTALDGLAEEGISFTETLATHTNMLTEHEQLLPKLGNCKIYWESYLGSGEDYRTFIFPEAPMFFWITLAKEQATEYNGQTTSLFYMKDSMIYPNRHDSIYPDEDFTISDGGKTIYYRVYNNPSFPMNMKNIRYCLIALIAADQK